MYILTFRYVVKPVDIGSKVMAVKEFVAPGEGPRFRKRDRFEFMGRRVVRKAKDVGTYIRGGQGRKRRDVARLFKKVFNKKGSPSSSLSKELRKDLPEEYLEEEHDEAMDGGQAESGVPEALAIVLKNLRVFGHFGQSMLIELMRNIEHVTVRQNDYLFKVGDLDASMYIVESGSLSVICEDAPVAPVGAGGGDHSASAASSSAASKPMELKQVHEGEPIVSLLSFLDYLAGKRKVYKTVSARAMQETKLIKISFEGFKNAFDKDPSNLAGVVQVVMVRLQRVTLLALHQYLGLGAELLSPLPRGNVHGGRRHHHSAGGGGNSHNAGASSAREREESISATSSPEKQKPGPDDGGQQQGPDAAGAAQQKELSPQTSSTEDQIPVPSVFRSRKKISQMGDDQLRDLSAKAFMQYLGLSDEDLVDDERSRELLKDFEIATYSEGEVLTEEESTMDGHLFLVLAGSVVVTQRDVENVPREMYRSYQGGLLGQLQVLTNEPAFFSYTVPPGTNVKCAVLNQFNVRKIMERHPHVSLSLAMSVVANLSPHVRSIDFALEWVLVESGKALYKQESSPQAENTYVVLSGE